MSQQLEPATQPAPAPAPANVPADVPPSWAAAIRLVARIQDAPIVPAAYRGNPGNMLACIITGEELGLKPMQALRMINVIDGKAAASAELMRALVNRAGHRIDVVEAKGTSVTMAGRRKDTGAQARVTWTLEDAQRAKLTGNPSWGKYPRAMLLARATSELCRMLFADVIGGLYTQEETAAVSGHVYELDADTALIDPVTGDDLDLETDALDPADDGGAVDLDADALDPADDDDAADAAWVAQAKAEAAGIDTATGELRHTGGA